MSCRRRRCRDPVGATRAPCPRCSEVRASGSPRRGLRAVVATRGRCSATVRAARAGLCRRSVRGTIIWSLVCATRIASVVSRYAGTRFRVGSVSKTITSAASPCSSSAVRYGSTRRFAATRPPSRASGCRSTVAQLAGHTAGLRATRPTSSSTGGTTPPSALRSRSSRATPCSFVPGRALVLELGLRPPRRRDRGRVARVRSARSSPTRSSSRSPSAGTALEDAPRPLAACASRTRSPTRARRSPRRSTTRASLAVRRLPLDRRGPRPLRLRARRRRLPRPATDAAPARGPHAERRGDRLTRSAGRCTRARGARLRVTSATASAGARPCSSTRRAASRSR